MEALVRNETNLYKNNDNVRSNIKSTTRHTTNNSSSSSSNSSSLILSDSNNNLPEVVSGKHKNSHYHCNHQNTNKNHNTIDLSSKNNTNNKNLITANSNGLSHRDVTSTWCKHVMRALSYVREINLLRWRMFNTMWQADFSSGDIVLLCFFV